MGLPFSSKSAADILLVFKSSSSQTLLSSWDIYIFDVTILPHYLRTFLLVDAFIPLFMVFFTASFSVYFINLLLLWYCVTWNRHSSFLEHLRTLFKSISVQQKCQHMLSCKYSLRNSAEHKRTSGMRPASSTIYTDRDRSSIAPGYSGWFISQQSFTVNPPAFHRRKTLIVPSRFKATFKNKQQIRAYALCTCSSVSLIWNFSSDCSPASEYAALLPLCWHLNKSIKSLPLCSATRSIKWNKSLQARHTLFCGGDGQIPGACWRKGSGTYWRISPHNPQFEMIFFLLLACYKSYRFASMLFSSVWWSAYIPVWYSGVGRKSIKPFFCIVLRTYKSVTCMWKRLCINGFIPVQNCTRREMKIKFHHS